MNDREQTKQQSNRSQSEDEVLKQAFRMLPDPQPSHSFDVRLTEALLSESRLPPLQPAKHRGKFVLGPGKAELSGGLVGLFGSPWSKAFFFSILFVFAIGTGYQWSTYEKDLMKVDLLVLISQELL